MPLLVSIRRDGQSPVPPYRPRTLLRRAFSAWSALGGGALAPEAPHAVLETVVPPVAPSESGEIVRLGLVPLKLSVCLLLSNPSLLYSSIQLDLDDLVP